MVYTTIKLNMVTKNELDLFREYKNESYDEVINKLVYIAKNVKNEPELSADVIKQIEAARKRVREGKVVSEAELRKRLGL